MIQLSDLGSLLQIYSRWLELTVTLKLPWSQCFDLFLVEGSEGKSSGADMCPLHSSAEPKIIHVTPVHF